MDESTERAVEAAWKPLYRLGAAAAVAMLVLMPIQTAAFLVAPPPATAAGFFHVF